MTATGLLSRLHELGVEVAVVDGRLVLRGRGQALTPELRQAVMDQKAHLLLLIGAQAPGALPVERRCPRCTVSDYMPLPGGWRRCWACGTRWGVGRDPGEPPDVDSIATLLAPPRDLVTGSGRVGRRRGDRARACRSPT